jgi:hypothetical protein
VAAVEGVSAPVAGPLAEALARGRSAFNARVAAAKHESPGLDEGALLELVRGLDPAVRAAYALDAGCADRVTEGLFDAAIELVARRIAGPGARHPEVDAGWRALLATAPRLVRADARRVAAALANALVNLAACPGARVSEWTEGMRTAADLAGDVDAWLDAGKVLAWRAGMAHARAGALEACATMAPELVVVALGWTASVAAGAIAAVVAGLRADPWATPGALADGAPRDASLRLVTMVGGFRGFEAGPFLAPPLVAHHAGALLVTDGERAWELHADAFGATLTPAKVFEGGAQDSAGATLAPGGEVRLGEERRVFAILADASSWAATPSTLVATRACSHRIAVVARAERGS